jgi:hypothetical protein
VDELAFLTAYRPNAGKEHYGKVSREVLGADKLDKV